MATRQRPSRSALATAPTAPLRTVDSFLWDAETLAGQSGFFGQQLPGFLEGIKAQLQSKEIQLDAFQWAAWQRALAYRLTLIWGPPGTGKSQTLRALVSGIAIAARSLDHPTRVLISAANYKAFDNILGDSAEWLSKNLGKPIALYRLRSSYGTSQVDPRLPIIDLENNATSPAIKGLLRTLTKPSDVVIVAATPSQIFRLVTRDDKKGSPIDELFDFIIIDEATQIDTGKTLPLICAASRNAQIVLAGDPMQLAPIAATPPPQGTEYLVGSIYSYLKERFKLSGDIEPTLLINYRSNEEIVSYGRMLGYPTNYQSNAPLLRLSLTNLMKTPTPSWPDFLEWTPAWERILDPAFPVVCFSYSEGRSGQSNRFESQVIACLLKLLWLAQPRRRLEGVRSDLKGPPILHTPETFWKQGVGIVTPHSAQRAMILSDLQRAFNPTPQESRLIREAVDTVERFQGQQRDVILASFAVGDPDVVAQEDRFLLILNRFNVMASRARAKLIVLVTDEILDHLPIDEQVLAGSRAIKLFVGRFCQNPVPLGLPWRDKNGIRQMCEGFLRTVP